MDFLKFFESKKHREDPKKTEFVNMVRINELYHNIDYYVWMMQPKFYTTSLMNYYSALDQYREANKGEDPF